MPSVALVGFAPNTLEHVRLSSADEIWSIVWAYKYHQFSRLNRLFEMHPIWMQAESRKKEYVKPREHWAWLKVNKQFPVYMLEDRQEVPACVRYPIEDVTRDLLGGWTRSGKPMHLFTSSFDFMIALAIHEGFDEIEIIGAEMSSDSEFRYQREGYAFWHGFALGHGVRINQHAPTQLLYKPRRYGYDGFQMIYRQDLERLRNEYGLQHRDALARVQFFEGQVQTAREAVEMFDGDEQTRARLVEHLETKIQRLNSERDILAISSGALQTVDYLIKEIDLEENDSTLNNPFETVVTTQKAKAAEAAQTAEAAEAATA